MNILDNLNEKQKEAVLTTEGPLLILAGAGSGKTRTIIHRIAYIMTQGLARPWEILALTFTNKAAGEMRDRIDSMGIERTSDIWMGTFHSICARILRMEGYNLGYSPNFSIYDEDDSKRLIKACMKELDLNERQFSSSRFRYLISTLKNSMVSAEEFAETYSDYMDTYEGRITSSVYSMYQDELKKSNSMDFDDLLVNINILFDEHPDVLSRYQNRFRYVLVDEYQDTNMVQYQIVSKISKKHRNLCVCGDDDQSIYEWRGASIRNILEFNLDFEDATVIKLEQNYRCTKNILNAANEVIDNNENRMGKTLFTQNETGDLIHYSLTEDDISEAAGIAREIYRLCEYHGKKYSDMAVLYRQNSQSRVLEESLIRRRIPYQIVAGTKFYDRMEIRDILAYLRLLVNEKDDGAFRRIINVPKRGIGPATVERLADYADLKGRSMFETAMDIESCPIFKGAVKNRLTEFKDVMTSIKDFKENARLTEIVSFVISETGYDQMLRDGKVENSQSRLDNLDELINAAGDFEENVDDSLEAFLENASLVAGVDNYDETSEKVLLMTLHNAKGLEFDTVFIPGMEENLFPSFQSRDSTEKLEEERRLCYVGITRAMNSLYLSGAERRRVFGRYEFREPSRFIEEIPESLMDGKDVLDRKEEEKNITRKYIDSLYNPYERKKSFSSQSRDYSLNEEYQAGDRVSHKIFGEGTVISADKMKDDYKLTVAFPGQGIKKIIAGIAGVEKIK